jgi:hypothetical protein
MFPLSYPATAKTLMARYGFLDLEDRQQREELQLQGLSSRFVYPPQNVYCSVNAQSKVVVLMSNEIVSNDSFAFLPVNNFHLNTQSEPSRIFKHLQYGIPYHLITRTSSPPVMLDLLNAFSVPNALFNYADDSEDEYSQFIESLSNSDSGLYMGFLSAEQLAKVDVRALANTASVMLIAQGENQMYRMYSNFTDTKQASTNEDIAPTVMNEFECLAEVYRFSTGQALQTPSRQWLVSTMQENIFFFKAPYLTEVSKDGSYKVTDVRDQSEVLIDIDTNMLSRSIKHLENFSR